ncbi:hypothetical protein KI387_029165, partial [Taxus chinensis]
LRHWVYFLPGVVLNACNTEEIKLHLFPEISCIPFIPNEQLLVDFLEETFGNGRVRGCRLTKQSSSNSHQDSDSYIIHSSVPTWVLFRFLLGHLIRNTHLVVNLSNSKCRMVKSVGNLEAAVEEIMALYRSFPPRPSAEEVDAALFLIGNVDATQSTHLQNLSRQVKPLDVPEELFSVMQEMRRIRIEMQAEEEKREALALLQLEDHHRIFDYIFQKASITVPSSSSSPPDYELDSPLSVMNTAKVTENHPAIMDDIAIFEPKVGHTETQNLGKESKYARDDNFRQNPKPIIPTQ